MGAEIPLSLAPLEAPAFCARWRAACSFAEVICLCLCRQFDGLVL